VHGPLPKAVFESGMTLDMRYLFLEPFHLLHDLHQAKPQAGGRARLRLHVKVDLLDQSGIDLRIHTEQVA
jgi:hypothetical protein